MGRYVLEVALNQFFNILNQWLAKLPKGFDFPYLRNLEGTCYRLVFRFSVAQRVGSSCISIRSRGDSY